MSKTETVRPMKEKILREGLKLIQTKGYNGFSYKDISDKIGIQKASIHYHFKSKEELGVGALEYYGKNLIAKSEDLFSQDIHTHEKLDAYFDFFLYWFNRGQRACPAGVLTAEYSTLPRQLQKEVKTLADYSISWIERVLMEGIHSKSLHVVGSVRDRANEIATTVQGGLLWARIYGLSYFETIIDGIRTSLISRPEY